MQEWLQALANFGYPGIFLLSFIGASSVVIPIPYTVILLAVAPAFNPLLLAIAAGLGSAAGELVGYGVGSAGRSLVGKKQRRNLNAMLKIFERFGIPVIFIFSLTPLPDDLLFIPLGLMHYSLWKTFPVCVAGKFAMSLAIAYTGKFAGELFTIDWPIAIATAISLVLVLIAIFRIDWVKLAEKYAKSGKKTEHGKSIRSS